MANNFVETIHNRSSSSSASALSYLAYLPSSRRFRRRQAHRQHCRTNNLNQQPNKRTKIFENSFFSAAEPLLSLLTLRILKLRREQQLETTHNSLACFYDSLQKHLLLLPNSHMGRQAIKQTNRLPYSQRKIKAINKLNCVMGSRGRCEPSD